MLSIPTVNRWSTSGVHTSNVQWGALGSQNQGDTKGKTTTYPRLDSLSLVSRQSDFAMSVVKIAAVITLLLTVGVGNVWGSAYLKGSWDSWTNHDISGGSCEISLAANTEYEFGIDVDGSFYSYTNQNFKNTSTSFQIYTSNGNCKITTGEAGTYIFKTWYDNGRYMAVYFPQARLVKKKYIYFDARNQTNWNSSNFDARFWFKYYDSGSDNGSVDCNKGNALENWVYYALVPNHDYIGQIQMNRLNPSNHDDVWCTANIAYAKDRTASAQNCLKEESGKADYCIYWTPQWTTYCPPMSSVTLADNGTTNWGGNGSSSTPYLVPTGGDIKVHVTASASALDDANMTQYFLFKKAGSAVGSGSSSTEKTITASGTTGTKEAVIVEAYNYYNSTEGTHLASSEIYYEARTPYTISYNAGTNGSGSRDSETKLKGVSFTLPNSAVFERTGYTQTGWTTSDGGTQTHALGGSYTGDAAQTFYPAWTPKTYTINLANMLADDAGTESVEVTYDASTNMTSAITKPTKAHYDFGGYWTSENTGGTLDNKVIDENGNWIKDVTGYTGNDGAGHPTWVHDYAISLFAKWTEHEYAVTLAVSPAGTGTTSPASSTTAKYVTASGDIEAIPNAGYSFSEWDFSKTDAVNDIYCADTYTSTSNPVHIHAVHDGTLTANFTPNTYTVRFENLGADAGHKGSLDTTVTFNDTINMKGGIEVPSKSHYDFGGYYISTDQGVTLTNIQIIDANGNWNKDVSGYTGTKDNVASWVRASDTVLYAKWTEHEYSITMEVSPAGTGTTSPASTATGKLVTESGNITATPAAGYKFKEWQFSKTGEAYDVWCADGYSSTDATIHIKAQHNGTLTAVFEERYSLVGSLYDGSEGGMPGWEDYSKTFTVNSSSPVDLTRTCTLQAGKTYKVQVHDLATSTNLGRSGCDPVCVLEENASLVMENSNNDVFLYTSGAGEYIFKITAVDGSGHPTLTVLRPYPVNFGQKYQDIDGTLQAGTTGGTAAATAGSALSSGDYVTYNTSVTHTATPASGYTFAGWWSSDAFEGDRFSNTNPMTYAVTSGDNTYAKFEETSTSVTLSNDGHGKVQIGGADATSTTCGVTTTRELTAVPNDGYKFSSWSKSGDDITLSSTSTNPTTLSGNGSGATSGQTVTANFVERYSIKGTMNGENWGTTHTLTNIGTNAGSKDTCYVTMTLPANTTYEFAIYDEQTDGWYKAGTDAVYDMTYTNHTNWEFGDTRTYNCGITTAGKGTYKFIFNITDKTVTVVYPTSYQVNYGASVGGSATSVEDGDGNAVPNGGYVVAGGSVKYTATANDGYTFVGWCGSDAYGDTFTDINPWTNSSVAATSNAYAKFKSTNFVIYRSGDKDDDPRAALDDVESYAGGTISEAIEYRMKVRDLDMWYSLCLPFTVSAVKVWDEDDGPAYYDIEPYYRSGGKFYTGHYIIRTPRQTTDLPIAEFGDWRDPISPTGYVPTKDAPYIIQWHNSYFLNKYVSFFGATGQKIPTSFSAGTAPSSDNVVNVCVNKSMQTGSVAGAYMLESDYGNGAWLRLDNADESRPIPPFECYLLVNNPTRARYMAIRPGMTAADTPTGWDDVVNSETKTHIVVYSISGVCVTQYSNCSINEAGQRLSESYGEGLYILRADNESVKLMVGGK